MKQQDITSVSTLPHSDNHERRVLGVLMNYDEAYDDVCDTLTAACFFNPMHKQVFEAVQALHEQRQPCTLIDVAAAMHADVTMLLPIDEAATTRVNLESDVYLLDSLLTKRKVYAAAQSIANKALQADSTADELLQALHDIDQSAQQAKEAGTTTLDDARKGLYDIINNNLAGVQVGVPTGFKAFDSISALRYNNLFVIAAQSGVGKTSMALAMCMAAVRSGVPAMFFTTEMSKEELFARILAGESGVNSNTIVAKRLDNTRLAAIDKHFDNFAGLPMFFDEASTNDIAKIERSIRANTKRHGVKVVFVDYLQNIGAKGHKEERERFAFISRKLKNIATELGIAVVLLSQLSRLKDNNSVPRLDCLRGAGEIEESADVVALLYRPASRPETAGYNYPAPYESVSTINTCQVIVAKGRNIGTPSFIVGFNAELTRFYDIDSNNLPQAQCSRKVVNDPFA